MKLIRLFSVTLVLFAQLFTVASGFTVPRNPTTLDAIELGIQVVEVPRQSSTNSSFVLNGFNVDVRIVGYTCEFGCGVSTGGTYRFAVGRLPAGTYSVRLSHFYDDGVRLVPADTLIITDRTFIVSADTPVAPQGAVGVPLSPLTSLLGIPLLFWVVVRRRRNNS